MTVHRVEQRSDQWLQLHAGCITSSSAAAMLAMKVKGGEMEKRALLRRRLVSERLTGLYADGFGAFLPADVQRGVDCEPLAFEMYEAQTLQLVDRVGFVTHDTLAAGCSPDGVINNFEGIVELKCPRSTTHLEYLQAGVVPEEYLAQVRHVLWVTGAGWCDFVSFDDRFPPELQMFRVRLTREQANLDAYELLVRLFLDEVERDYQAALKPATVAVEAL